MELAGAKEKRKQSQYIKMNKADDTTLSETRRKQAVLAGNSETPGQGEHRPFLQQVGAREALAKTSIVVIMNILQLNK